jgi:predicted nucleotidyltransferase
MALGNARDYLKHDQVCMKKYLYVLRPLLPEEVGLRLLKSPTAPKELPSTLFIRNVNGIAAWKHFLVE